MTRPLLEVADIVRAQGDLFIPHNFRWIHWAHRKVLRAIARCRGRIVFGEEADELRRVVLGLLNETQRIVLNLAWIEHIDSSGLGTLVASFISARHRGAEIRFAALSPRVRRALTSTNVDQLFEVYDSTEEAIKCSVLNRKLPLGDIFMSRFHSRPVVSAIALHQLRGAYR
jgi:anti-sigma B factor antagonist